MANRFRNGYGEIVLLTERVVRVRNMAGSYDLEKIFSSAEVTGYNDEAKKYVSICRALGARIKRKGSRYFQDNKPVKYYGEEL